MPKWWNEIYSRWKLYKRQLHPKLFLQRSSICRACRTVCPFMSINTCQMFTGIYSRILSKEYWRKWMLMQKMEMCERFAKIFVYFCYVAMIKSYYHKPTWRKVLPTILLAQSSLNLWLLKDKARINTFETTPKICDELDLMVVF